MKNRIFSFLACMYICVGVQQASAQDYAIGVYNRAINEISPAESFVTTSGKQVKMYQNGILFKNSGNQIEFFLYKKPKGDEKQIKIETLPNMNVSTATGTVLPAYGSPSTIVILPTELGKTTIKVTCEVNKKKISQEFAFDVVAVPTPTVVLLDEKGKKIVVGVSSDGVDAFNKNPTNVPNSMKPTVVYDKVFMEQCPKDGMTKVDFSVIIGRGPKPAGKFNYSSQDSNEMDFTEIKKVAISGDRLIFQPTLTRSNFRGEIVNDVLAKDKYMMVLVK